MGALRHHTSISTRSPSGKRSVSAFEVRTPMTSSCLLVLEQLSKLSLSIVSGSTARRSASHLEQNVVCALQRNLSAGILRVNHSIAGLRKYSQVSKQSRQSVCAAVHAKVGIEIPSTT